MTRVRLLSPLDMHLHLREGEMLQTVAPLSVAAFAGAVIMPNLVPPVTNRERLEHYRAAIRAVTGEAPFEPYMTLFFQPYDEQTLRELRAEIIGIKLYPAGVTTNSEAGVQAIEDAAPTLAIMEELGIPLLVHGETHGFVLDREREFLAVYSSARRVNVPTEKRGVSMVFQSYAIWPHMSVFDNVAYGLRVRCLGKLARLCRRMRPFPATAWAEGPQLNAAPSCGRTRVQPFPEGGGVERLAVTGRTWCAV